MIAFAALLDRLVQTSRRDARTALLADYLRRAPDPDRGTALAALTGGLDIPKVSPAALRALALSRIDAALFDLSREYTGDTAEAAALAWPARPGAGAPPRLSEVARGLAAAGRDGAAAALPAWLDALDPAGRRALLALATGRARPGGPPLPVAEALAALGGADPAEAEEAWRASRPPYIALFVWLEGRGPRPRAGARPAFRPPMPSRRLEGPDPPALAPADWIAEWQWDGLRAQLSARGGERRLYARNGADISAAFPEILEAAGFDAVLDGELLPVRGRNAPGGDGAGLAEARRRLGRAGAAARQGDGFPARLALYDILFDGAEDLRGLPLAARRARLGRLFAHAAPPRMDLSETLAFDGPEDLARLRGLCRERGRLGLALKRRDTPYAAGRADGAWLVWPRPPLSAVAVAMYAERGEGAAAPAAWTFGVWRAGPAGDELVPVCKTARGPGAAGRRRLEDWARANTVARFGPVREVAPALAVEIAFDAVDPAPRRKAGLELRRAEIRRVPGGRPAASAARLEDLERLLDPPGPGG